jgi:ATP sulfurylase
MFLGVYRFKGQADELLAAYDRLMATMPMEDLELHVCTHNDQGIAIYDTCPSREEFDTFANGESLRDALAAAGLPPPEVEYIGEVHTAFWAGERKR